MRARAGVYETYRRFPMSGDIIRGGSNTSGTLKLRPPVSFPSSAVLPRILLTLDGLLLFGGTSRSFSNYRPCLLRCRSRGFSFAGNNGFSYPDDRFGVALSVPGDRIIIIGFVRKTNARLSHLSRVCTEGQIVRHSSRSLRIVYILHTDRER